MELPVARSATVLVLTEVCPDRGFEWLEDEVAPIIPSLSTKNGMSAEFGEHPELLTQTDLVRMHEQKAPRV